MLAILRLRHCALHFYRSIIYECNPLPSALTFGTSKSNAAESADACVRTRQGYPLNSWVSSTSIAAGSGRSGSGWGSYSSRMRHGFRLGVSSSLNKNQDLARTSSSPPSPRIRHSHPPRLPLAAAHRQLGHGDAALVLPRGAAAARRALDYTHSLQGRK